MGRSKYCGSRYTCGQHADLVTTPTVGFALALGFCSQCFGCRRVVPSPLLTSNIMSIYIYIYIHIHISYTTYIHIHINAMHILYTYTRYITPKTWFILVSCLCWEHQHTHTRNYIQYTLVCIITYLPIDYTDLYSTYAIHLLIEKSMTSWRPTTSTGTLMDTSSGRCCCCSMLPSRWKVCCQDWLLAGWNLVENQADLFCYKGCTVWRNLELRKCGRKHNKT